MTTRTQAAGESRPASAAVAPPELARRATPAGLVLAAIQSARPRQWPKNLLVFAAPLAGATLGRDNGFAYALAAAAAFTAASAAVYLVNDVMDAERDRSHPTKRLRPVASGRLPVRWRWRWPSPASPQPGAPAWRSASRCWPRSSARTWRCRSCTASA